MYEFICKNGNKILSEVELPKWESGHNKGKISCKTMKGMVLSVEYNGLIYHNVHISNYTYGNNKATFDIGYKNKHHSIICSDFMIGHFGGFLNIDLNNKYIDDEGVVHIHIKNTKGQEYEALYSGNNVDKVMEATWYMSNGYVLSKTVIKGKKVKLHHVDLKGSAYTEIIKHINNNPLDNRIENLAVSDFSENTKNKNTNNKLGLTGLSANGKTGYVNRFTVDGHRIHTQTRHNLEEAKLDNLIAQRYLGYKHNEDLFYLLDGLDEERVEEVTATLDNYIQNNKNKILKEKHFDYSIEEKDDYYILHKNGKEMLFDCDPEFIKNKRMWESRDYWTCEFVEDNKHISNRFHRELMGLRSNDYLEYNVHIDHLNHNHSDNRYENLIITTSYGNQCNKNGKGYSIEKAKYRMVCMCDYRFWDLIGGTKRPSFIIEQEAINEVNRRRKIVDNCRVKLKSKEELDELITYCLDNNYILENGLADLDLGYLHWNNILKSKEVA